MEAGGCALLVVVIAIVIAAAIAGSESMRRSRFRALEFATRRWEGRPLLDAEVRRGLMTVRHSSSWIAWYDISLDVGSEGVMLRISRLIVGDATALGAFIDLAAAIFRKVRDGEAPVGIVLAAVETRAG